MSIREAVRLVLTAGILGQDGEVYVFDMGKPIRIVEVAQKMISLYGRRDVPILFTGLRPGEKLTEELWSQGEDTEGTRFKKVSRVLGMQHSLDVRRWVMETEVEISSLGENELGERLRSFAMELCAGSGDRQVAAAG